MQHLLERREQATLFGFQARRGAQPAGHRAGVVAAARAAVLDPGILLSLLSQRLELLGSEGLLSAGNIIENTVSKATTAGVTSAKPEFFFLERYMRAYGAEWDAFVQAALQGAALPVSLQDGINALALGEAATRSAQTGETVEITAAMLGA